MSFPESIESYNYRFLSSMEEGRKVGLDDKGHLYYLAKDAKTEGIAKDIFSTIVFTFLVNKIKETRNQGDYLKAVDQFVTLSLLSVEQRDVLAHGYYEQRYDDLIKSGLRAEVAEATVTLAMSLDPNISEANRKKMQPEFVISGSSGVYFLKDRKGGNVGVFKPSLQEPFMKDNPHRHPDPDSKIKRKLRAGHEDGSGWLCEAAAYAIADDGYMGVPFTTKLTLPFARLWHVTKGVYEPDNRTIINQEGSFQVFVKGVKSVAEVSSIYADIPVEEAQKIVAFDLMIEASDRNANNVFWDGQAKKMIPIDHGLTFLDNLDWKKPLDFTESWTDMAGWPQMKQSLNKKTKDWILNYHLDEQCQKLKALGISDGAIRAHRVRVLFMKEGVKQGFNLHQLGKLSLVMGGFSMANTWLNKLVKTQAEALSKNVTQEEFEKAFQKTLEKELKKQKGKV